jgi:hypothetical protein
MIIQNRPSAQFNNASLVFPDRGSTGPASLLPIVFSHLNCNIPGMYAACQVLNSTIISFVYRLSLDISASYTTLNDDCLELISELL